MQTKNSQQEPLQTFSHISLEDTGLLMGLGLTGRQARVYLALLRCDVAKVKVLAGLAMVERQEVYGLIDSLSALGLVRRNLSTSPATFVPTPIREGVRLLLAQKAHQFCTMRQQTKGLIEKYSQTAAPSKMLQAKPCFGIVYEADRGKKYLNAIKICVQSIDAITSWRRFKQLSIHFETQLSDALKEGVRLRFVTEKPLNHRWPKWVKLASDRYPNFEVKTALGVVEVGVVVFDGALVALAFDPESSLGRGPDLWSGHGGLVVACRGYFEGCWAALE